jgi:quercetin dioxygenase-like cupin family protein
VSTVDVEELTRSWDERGFNCEEHTDAPGKGVPRHAFDHDELVVVIEGDIEINVAGKTMRPGKGEEVVIPAGTEHEVRNVGQKPARRLHGFERDLAFTD